MEAQTAPPASSHPWMIEFDGWKKTYHKTEREARKRMADVIDADIGFASKYDRDRIDDLLDARLDVLDGRTDEYDGRARMVRRKELS